MLFCCALVSVLAVRPAGCELDEVARGCELPGDSGSRYAQWTETTKSSPTEKHVCPQGTNDRVAAGFRPAPSHWSWRSGSGQSIEIDVFPAAHSWLGTALFTDLTRHPESAVLHWDGDRPGEFRLGEVSVSVVASSLRTNEPVTFRRIALTVRRGSDVASALAILDPDGRRLVAPPVVHNRDVLEGFLRSTDAQIVASVAAAWRAGNIISSEPGLSVHALFDLVGCVNDFVLITALVGAAIETCSLEPAVPFACFLAWYAVYQAEMQIIEACNCCFL